MVRRPAHVERDAWSVARPMPRGLYGGLEAAVTSLATCRGVGLSPQELCPLLLGENSARDSTCAVLPDRRLCDDRLRHPVGPFERDGALIGLDDSGFLTKVSSRKRADQSPRSQVMIAPSDPAVTSSPAARNSIAVTCPS